jgi:transcriptional regulator with XRE-family HTH domain
MTLAQELFEREPTESMRAARARRKVIVDLRDQGLTFAAIGRKIGVTASHANNLWRRAAHRDEMTAKQFAHSARNRARQRALKCRCRAHAMSQAGMYFEEIAEELGISTCHARRIVRHRAHELEGGRVTRIPQFDGDRL